MYIALGFIMYSISIVIPLMKSSCKSNCYLLHVHCECTCIHKASKLVLHVCSTLHVVMADVLVIIVLGVHRIVVEDLIVAAIDTYNEEACLNESESSTSLHSGDGEKEVEPTLAVTVGITEANSTETQHNNSDMGKVPQESPSVEVNNMSVVD